MTFNLVLPRKKLVRHVLGKGVYFEEIGEINFYLVYLVPSCYSNSVHFMMSHLRDSDEEAVSDEEYEGNRIFHEKFPYSQDSKDAFKEYYILGAMKSKLLFTSKNIREDTKHGYDPISKFVLDKRSFTSGLSVSKGFAARGPVLPYLERLEKHIQASTKDHWLKMRTDTWKLMKFALTDPDPYFFGHYNWYYTGGTLHSVCNENGYFLLFVERGKKSNLCVAPLKSDGSWKIDNNCIIRATPNDGKEIFQVLGKNNSPLIGVRQKNACTVFSSLQHDNSLQKCFETTSEIPFTSFDISLTRNELCTINCNFVLSFWDLSEKNNPVFSPFSSDNTPHDKWHSLWYSKSSPFDLVVATRSSLRWYDRRNSCLANSMELSCISGVENEEISVHFESQCYSNAIYIGTNVSLLLMDARMLETPVHRWSHRMTHPPLYSAVVSPSNGKEVACIANHYPGDAVLAFSTPDYSYPLVELPSNIESLLIHQARGQFLDPSLKPRLAPALSGVAAVSTPGSLDTSVFTQIHTSEVFSHSLFHSDEEADFSCLKAGKETLHASERWDMSKMYESLSNINQKSVNYTTIPSSSGTTKQEWQWDIKDLKKYKDALSTILLEEWEDDIEETEKESLNMEKVSAWLHQQFNTTSQEDVVCDESYEDML